MNKENKEVKLKLTLLTLYRRVRSMWPTGLAKALVLDDGKTFTALKI